MLLSAKKISNFNNNVNVNKDEFNTNDKKLNKKFKHRIKIRKNADSIVVKLLKEIYEKKDENKNNNKENLFDRIIFIFEFKFLLYLNNIIN